MKVMIQECGITNAINTHGEDDDYINKAKIKCLDFVHQLYLVVVGSEAIQGIVVVGCLNEKISKNLHQITKVELTLKKRLQIQFWIKSNCL